MNQPASTTTPEPAQAPTKEELIALCERAGIRWIPPDDEEGGFPGGFDMATLREMGSLVALVRAGKPAQAPVGAVPQDCVAVPRRLYEAWAGLCFGVDWNEGTHAKAYRKDIERLMREPLPVAATGAAREAAAVADASGLPFRSMSRDVRAALMFALWHHQGGSSPVGQPIRALFGIGQHERLSDHALSEAKRVQAALAAPTPADSLGGDQGEQPCSR
jgi:hypothetical protein